MDNISKTKNERCEFNSCSISDINSFITKIYEKMQLENIVTSYLKFTYKRHTILFEFERNIMNGKRIFSKKS